MTEKKTTWPRPPKTMLEYLERKFPAVKITAEDLMDCSSVPREEWEAELISDLPRRFQRRAWILADRAREAAAERETIVEGE